MNNVPGTLMRMSKHLKHFLMAVFLLLSFVAYAADETPATTTGSGSGTTAAGNGCTEKGYYDKLGGSENSGSYDGCNSIGCCGKYQFCPGTLNTYLQRNGIDKDTFMNGYDSNGQRWQETVIQQFTADNQSALNSSGASRYVGQPFTMSNGQTIEITNSGILGGSHLGGAGGVNKFLTSGGTYNPMDGRDKNNPRCREMLDSGASVSERNSGGLQCGTAISDYIQKFNGFDTAAGAGNGNCAAGGGNSNNKAGLICDPEISAEVTNQVQAALARKTDFINTYLTPPPLISQVANTPCMSRELGRINNQFRTMLHSGVTGVARGVGMSSGGPVGSLMNQAFKQDFNNMNSVATMIPKMLDFQGMASTALGSLLSSLGLDSAFSSQMCGLMLDMVLKYIQCENPIKFPNLSNMFGSLNLNLPNNCAGQAARAGLMNLSRTNLVRSYSQGVTIDAKGGYALTPMQ